MATEIRLKCGGLGGAGAFACQLRIETMAGETACPTSDASQRGGNAKGLDLEAGN